jgi:hypothetical protein
VKSVKKPSKISMELIAEAVPHASAKPKIAPVAVAVAVDATAVEIVAAVEAVMKDTAVTEIAAVAGATTVSATGACKILRKFLFRNKTAPV